MKKLRILFLAFLILASFCLGAVAAGNLEEIKAFLNYGITVQYDGEAQVMADVQGARVYPITYNDSTYLPVRAISNLLGVEIAWDGANNTVLLGQDATNFLANQPKPASRGKVSGTTYESSFIGLGFKAPNASWEAASDEEIESLTGYSAADLKNGVENLNAFCDVLMIDTTTGSNISLMIEKKSDSMKTIGFDAVYEKTVENLNSVLTNTYKSFSVKKEKCTIGQKSLSGYSIAGDTDSVTIYQKGFLIDLGTHVANVTISSTSQSEINSLLKTFYLVK